MLIEIKITLGLVLVIVFLGGVISNIAVLVLPPPKWTKNMATGNKLIKSLHAIDLIICVCLMPITFSVLMHSPEVNETLCFFHESLISFATSGGCINILFISLERYLSIGSLNSKSSKQSIMFLSIIWITSFIGFGLPWINAVVKTENADVVIDREKNLTIVDCEHLVTSFNEYNVYEVFGLGIFFDNPWMLGSFLPAAVSLYFIAIKKEEKYLEEKFGDEYLDYKKKVRRWI